ncbi:MAG: hypothetical protein ACR2N9_00015 [Acidimicrobiia bacterium]
MQAHTDHETAPNRSRAVRKPRRLFERVADYFSPTLACTECGARTKERHCDTTGAVRPKLTDKEWSRYAAMEVEYVCPSCGEAFWVLEVAPTYPIL